MYIFFACGSALRDCCFFRLYHSGGTSLSSIWRLFSLPLPPLHVAKYNWFLSLSTAVEARLVFQQTAWQTGRREAISMSDVLWSSNQYFFFISRCFILFLAMCEAALNLLLVGYLNKLAVTLYRLVSRNSIKEYKEELAVNKISVIFMNNMTWNTHNDYQSPVRYIWTANTTR